MAPWTNHRQPPRFSRRRRIPRWGFAGLLAGADEERPGELAEAWRSAGLLDVAETTLAIRMEYACFDDYWAPYDGLDGPAAEYVVKLEAEKRASLKDAVRRAYLDGEGDGPRSYVAVAWAVKGRVPGMTPSEPRTRTVHDA